MNDLFKCHAHECPAHKGLHDTKTYEHNGGTDQSYVKIHSHPIYYILPSFPGFTNKIDKSKNKNLIRKDPTQHFTL